MNIADRIQHLRKSKGISQEELADKIGVSRQAVSKWESEQSIPDIEKIILLSDYFETTTDFLLKGIEPAQELETKYSATVFSIVGTILNAIGLVSSIVIWIERQMVFAVGIGFVVMLLGTGILLFVPLSCCFNILDGLLGGFSGQLAPIPMLGNSFKTYILYWIIYIAICIGTDIFIKRNVKEK